MRPADKRHQTAPGKRQHERKELLRRDALVKQDQRQHHDDRRRGIQQHGRRGQVHDRDGLKIAICKKEQAADARAEKAPEIPQPDAKLLRIAHKDRHAEQQRGNAAAQQDRARCVHAASRQRAREQSHQPPKAAGCKDRRRIFVHRAPLRTDIFVWMIAGFQAVVNLRGARFCAAFLFAHLSSRSGCDKMSLLQMRHAGKAICSASGTSPWKNRGLRAAADTAAFCLRL